MHVSSHSQAADFFYHLLYGIQAEGEGFEPPSLLREQHLSRVLQYHSAILPERRVEESNPKVLPFPGFQDRLPTIQRYSPMWARLELNQRCLPPGNRFTACRHTSNSDLTPILYPRKESNLEPLDLKSSASASWATRALILVIGLELTYSWYGCTEKSCKVMV